MNTLSRMRFETVIGIGDLHGNHDALVELLDALHEKYGIFQDRNRLVLRPGVRIVFTGDRIDRGHEGLPIIEDCRRLEAANPGCIGSLAGNHELLALAGLTTAREALRRDDSTIAKWYEDECDHGYNRGLAFIGEFGDFLREAFESYVLGAR